MEENEIVEKVVAQEDLHYPPLVSRIQSIFIDLLIQFVGICLFSIALSFMENPSDSLRATLFVLLFFVYEPLLTSTGGTIGNRIMKMRVMKASNEQKKINILQAYIRFVLKVFLGWLSFVSIHFNKQRRAIHDLGSGSVMVFKNKTS